MNTTPDTIQDHFEKLPTIVQDTIIESNMEDRLRALAAKYKLHLDKWIPLENEIMLTLLDIHKPKDMVSHVSEEVGISKSQAILIVNDIAREIFTPIQEKLREASGDTSQHLTKLSSAHKTTPSDSLTYKAGEYSTQRSSVDGDPYRESTT